jgi:hypothetical protein
VFAAPDADDDDAARVRTAQVNSDRILCDRLFAAAKAAGWEAYFLKRDPATFDALNRMMLRRLAWFYRLRLPAYLRPRRNPDDPIVREMELSDGR